MKGNEARWALVTGASSGMGKAFAEELAKKGFSLFLVALEDALLAQFAQDLRSRYSVQVVFRALDLCDPNSLRTVTDVVEESDWDIRYLINAAGFGYFGDFPAMDTGCIRRMIDVNVTALFQLCHLILPRMAARQGGTIVNIASIAGHLPYPYAAVYSASKSAVHIFTNALWAENRDKRISIIALSPGHTRTNFDNVSKEPDSIHLFRDEDPGDIARYTLRSLDAGRCTLFTKFSHPFKVIAAKLLPLKVFAWLLYRMRQKAS